jgi:hypothetical protein
MIAAAAMAMSSLTVVSNSALLRRFKLRRGDENEAAAGAGQSPPATPMTMK